MGTIHRRRIDLRGELLVVADACRDIGGRRWMSRNLAASASRPASRIFPRMRSRSCPLMTPSAAAAEIIARAISTADSCL
jgi:hypothetical protein